jgi:hypothetical protein
MGGVGGGVSKGNSKKQGVEKVRGRLIRNLYEGNINVCMSSILSDITALSL